MSPFGLVPTSDLLLAGGTVSFVVFGVWFVSEFGWAEVEEALFRTLAVLVAGSYVLLAQASNLGERATGVFDSTNGLANTSALAVVVGFLFWARGRRSGIALVGSALPLLFLSDGRVSQLSVLVALVVATRTAVPRWLGWACLSTLIALSTVVATTGSVDRVGETVSRSGDADEITSVTGRTDVWDWAIAGIIERPIVGFGAASTSRFYEDRGEVEDEEIVFEVNDAHNMFLQTGLNAGLPAVVLLVVAVCSFWRRATRFPNPMRDAIVAVILMHGLTEHVVREPDGLLVLLAAAMATLAGGSASQAQSTVHPALVDHRLGGPNAEQRKRR